MLISLLLFVLAFLYGGVQWDSGAANATTAPTVTPQDPTSLTLALIGAGTLAVYLALSRTFRSRRRSMATTPRSTVARQSIEEHSADTPRKSRGAA